MEDKWKVYIKGDNDRGDEVIKALTDLGGNNSNHYNGNADTAYYYINPDGNIGYASIKGGPTSPFLHEFYTEIKLPKLKNWKDGTLLVRWYEGKREYLVYSHMDEKNNGDIVSYVYAYDEGYRTNITGGIRDFKPASKYDTNDFQELLHKHGKEWDFKNKILFDWKFEPENNEEYWYINDLAEICHTSYNQFMINDLKRVRIANCFQTKKDAITARDKMAKVLLNNNQ